MSKKKIVVKAVVKNTRLYISKCISLLHQASNQSEDLVETSATYYEGELYDRQQKALNDKVKLLQSMLDETFELENHFSTDL